MNKDNLFKIKNSVQGQEGAWREEQIVSEKWLLNHNILLIYFSQ